MTRTTRVTGEVEVTVSGFFTTHHYLETETGSLGELVLPTFSANGVFRAADGRELVARRTSWWRGWHELREDEVVVGTARPQGFWQRTTSVGFRGQVLRLEPVSFWGRGWRLVDQIGRTLVEVQPRGVFRRGAYLTVLHAVDADLLVFVYYLVNARWQEQSAAAAAGATAASGS